MATRRMQHMQVFPHSDAFIRQRPGRTRKPIIIFAGIMLLSSALAGYK